MTIGISRWFLVATNVFSFCMTIAIFVVVFRPTHLRERLFERKLLVQEQCCACSSPPVLQKFLDEPCQLLLRIIDTGEEDEPSEKELLCGLQGVDRQSDEIIDLVTIVGVTLDEELEESAFVNAYDIFPDAEINYETGELVVIAGGCVSGEECDGPDLNIAFVGPRYESGEGGTIRKNNRATQSLTDDEFKPSNKTFPSRSVLVVRIIGDNSSTSTSLSVADLQNDWFLDESSLATQMAGCSYGQESFVPAQGDDIDGGVTNVTINDEINYRSVTNSLASKIPFFRKFDHVAFCMPAGTLGKYRAFALANSPLSFYDGEYCGYVSAQMHEIGHNIGFGHSGAGSKEYGDSSSFMGSLSRTDDLKKCYNSAKTWQRGWFNLYHTVSPIGTNWEGRIYGLYDVDSIPTDINGTTAILRIESPTTYYYIHFNHATGPNAEVGQGANQVLMTQTLAKEDASKSTLIGTLFTGSTQSVPNLLENQSINIGMVVSVSEINTRGGFATVSVRFIDDLLATTGQPSVSPLTPWPSTGIGSTTPTVVPSTSPSLLTTSSVAPATSIPSEVPSEITTFDPTTMVVPGLPTIVLTASPSFLVTPSPIALETSQPSGVPSAIPTFNPTMAANPDPTPAPSSTPSSSPTLAPSELKCEWPELRGCGTRAEFDFSGLGGSVPSTIGLATSLTYLSFGLNSFDGSIPSEIGLLTSLAHIGMEVNLLTGPIPSELGLLTSLTTLSLSENLLFGSIPLEISQLANLTELFLENNMLTGSIPPELSQLPLELLFLNSNQFTNAIPSDFERLTTLQKLWLFDNDVSGTFTSALCDSVNPLIDCGEILCSCCKDLSSNSCPTTDMPTMAPLFAPSPGTPLPTRDPTPLPTREPTPVPALNPPVVLPPNACQWPELRGCEQSYESLDIRGTIPITIGLATQLTSLDIETSFVSGTLPTELGLLTRLTWLDLGSDNSERGFISGTLPTELGLLTRLTHLSLRMHRSLGGSLPSEIGLLTSLKTLNLSSSDYTGRLPAIFDRMTSLVFLDLGYNSVSGSIPTGIGRLTRLSYFRLGGNSFTGSLPTEIGRLQSVVYFHVVGNQLSGKLPSELGLLSDNNFMLLSSNALTGTIPSEMANFRLGSLSLSGNQLSGSISQALCDNAESIIIDCDEITCSCCRRPFLGTDC